MCLSVDSPVPGVVRVRIDSPPANALNETARRALERRLDGIDRDPRIRCAIITGTGTAFTAGADLKEQEQVEPQLRERYIRQFLALLRRIESSRVPFIAAINGHCHGGGLELALCCHIRVAARSATFVASGVNVGLIVSFQRLPRAVGMGRGLEMLLTGETYNAIQAEQWGLVTRVCDTDDVLQAESVALAERIASRAPLSIQTTKSAALSAFERTAAEADEDQVARFLAMSQTDDHHEALRAFREKRTPDFHGR